MRGGGDGKGVRDQDSEGVHNLAFFFGWEGGYSVYCNGQRDRVTAQANATVNDAKRRELIKKRGEDDTPGRI